MTRTCTICSHPQRAAIEAACVDSASYRAIARQYSVGHDSIQRHVASHIKQAISESQQAKEEARGLDVVKQLKNINEITMTILNDARKDKKQAGLALQAVDRVCKQLELQAKLLGDIDKPQVNIIISPEWQVIRTTLLSALTPFPDARVAVAGALAGLEDARARLN